MVMIISVYLISSSTAVLKSFKRRYSSRGLEPKLNNVNITVSKNLVLRLKGRQKMSFAK